MSASPPPEGLSRAWVVPTIGLVSALVALLGGVSISYLNYIGHVEARKSKEPAPGTVIGTAANSKFDATAPHIRWKLTSIDGNISDDDFVRRGKAVLDARGFTGITAEQGFVYGYSGEYVGVLLRSSPDLLKIMVAGPRWDVADTKVENLSRDF